MTKEMPTIEELAHIAKARADRIMPCHLCPFTVSIDAGIDGETPSLLINEFAVFPETKPGIGRRSRINWCVQSVEIDDAIDELGWDLDKAIICAASRALKRHLEENAAQDDRDKFYY